MYKSIEERFLNKVNKTDTCWIWTGAKTRGYGKMNISGRYTYATHVSMMLYKGDEIRKDGDMILHSCDNPPCVNPQHLRWGSHEENMREMAERKRQSSRIGELNPRAKLRAEDVKTMRTLHDQGFMYKDIAEIFEVHPSTASNAIRGRTWNLVEGYNNAG